MRGGEHYDVCIMGGGPAGATLGALLARDTSLRVAIFEQDFFPREHIGESFTHRAIPVLEESGALGKVLASQCYVVKFGGFYAWDEPPLARFFEHENFQREGTHRWSIHCNRAEFDTILLDHAKDVGVHVHEGVAVTAVTRENGVSRVTLSDGCEVECKIFVEASGRQSKLLGEDGDGDRRWLSDYKNIAIWNHYVGCRDAASLDYDWNIFHKPNISPIGNFSFEDGWFWYIPVPKEICGKRVKTHSIGLVTDPRTLKESGKRYTDARVLFEAACTVPLLRELLKDAQPVSDKVLTATNYSMISDRMCNYDEGWIRIGDSSFFVDPLFSSGIGFALASASGAAHIVQQTLCNDVPETQKRDFWQDYQDGWGEFAKSFAFAIDQWYHAIARRNPKSAHWRRRGAAPTFDGHLETFPALVDLAFVGRLFEGTPGGSDKNWQAIVADAPVLRTIEKKIAELNVQDTSVVRFASAVGVRRSTYLPIFPEKGVQYGSGMNSDSRKEALAKYWRDPVKNGDALPASYSSLAEVTRYHRTDAAGSNAAHVRIHHTEDAESLSGILRTGATYGEIKNRVTPRQSLILKRMLATGIAEAR